MKFIRLKGVVIGFVCVSLRWVDRRVFTGFVLSFIVLGRGFWFKCIFFGRVCG